MMSARAELNPSVVDRIKATLVGLRMPRALEIVDAIVRQLERGEVSALEAIDAMLAEEFTLRESRRIKTSLVMARLSNIKTLAGFDFAFQPSLDRNRILALAELKFIERTEVVHFIGPPGTGKSHLITLADLVGSLAKSSRSRPRTSAELRSAIVRQLHGGEPPSPPLLCFLAVAASR